MALVELVEFESSMKCESMREPGLDSYSLSSYTFFLIMSPPLDLSVLEGNDPAGYKAESLIKDRIQKSLHPDTAVDWERRSHHQGIQQNPGSVAAADSGQFHAYRKNRRHEMERIEAMERAGEIEREKEEFEKKRREMIAKEEAKTAKRRAKRKKGVVRRLKGSSSGNKKEKEEDSVDEEEKVDDKEEIVEDKDE